MLQRKFEIIINENVVRDNDVGSDISIRYGSPEKGYKVVEYKLEDAKLTEEAITEVVNMLMCYMLPEIPAVDVVPPETVGKFKLGPDGKFVRI